MARIRTIKPEFWQDEDLAGVSETACLLAIGLLNHADDEGYFKANPALVRAAVFPLREPSVSVQCALTELSDIRFIVLFQGSDGKAYGLVRRFAEHQKVNRPSPSKIKELLPISEDSVIPHGALTGGKEQGKEQGTGNREGDSASAAPNPSGPPPCPQSEILSLYHETLPELRRHKSWDGARSDNLRARWRSEPKRQSLDYWRDFFEVVRESDFLMGRVEPGPGRRRFQADLEWLVVKSNFEKVVEGKYHEAAA